jgi:hypothetical protein
MQLHTSKGVKKAKLTRTEIHKLTDAQMIVKDLTQFFPDITNLDEALSRIDSEGVVKTSGAKEPDEKEIDMDKVGV